MPVKPLNWQRRSDAFTARFGLTHPLLMAPMAGACPPALAAAVAAGGGMGAAGALLLDAAGIAKWTAEFRALGGGPLQLNLWIPDPAPVRDLAAEAAMRSFLAGFGPAVPEDAFENAPLADFDAQCHALLEAEPSAISSIMGLFPPAVAAAARAAGIAWFATATTVDEAVAAERAGADVIVAQGAEAGGHRGCFDAGRAHESASGLFALLPAIVDAVSVPVVATGGIADARGIAAALMLGASAVQIGTGLLRCPEAAIHPAWADALATVRPDQTRLTRAFSGRLGRALATDFVAAAATPDAPPPTPYPIQRALTGPMRAQAQRDGDLQRMQAWAGQSARLAVAEPAARLVERVWNEALALLAS
ncbi:MAG: nitronate monooxygenase [Burkholderiaceae bacterium]